MKRIEVIGSLGDCWLRQTALGYLDLRNKCLFNCVNLQVACKPNVTNYYNANTKF